MELEGLVKEYKLGDARTVANMIKALFNKYNIDEATREAYSSSDTPEQYRLVIYFPSKLGPMANEFQRLIANPDCGAEFKVSAVDVGRGVYSSWDQALEGRAIEDEIERVHPGFYVYDINGRVMVDLVDREGISQINFAIKQQYLSDMQNQLGCGLLNWKMPKDRIIPNGDYGVNGGIGIEEI